MKIVYHCTDGLFDSPLAAAIHLGLIPGDRRPLSGELRAFPHYGRLDRVPGRLYMAGWDEHGNEVFTLGRQKAPDFVIKLLNEAHKTLFEAEERFAFFDCQVTGGLFCSVMRKVGRLDPQFLNLAIRRSLNVYPTIASIVREAKARTGGP